jgi:hypothetical protein
MGQMACRSVGIGMMLGAFAAQTNVCTRAARWQLAPLLDEKGCCFIWAFMAHHRYATMILSC